MDIVLGFLILLYILMMLLFVLYCLEMESCLKVLCYATVVLGSDPIL